MTKPDKAAEPSMEEILASIRRIIAEEPIGTRPEPARRDPRPLPDPVAPLREQAGAQGARPAAHPGDMRHATVERTSTIRGAIALDDALADLIEQPSSDAAEVAAKPVQGTPAPPGVPPAGVPAAEVRQRASWLFSHPHPLPSAGSVRGGPHEPSRPAGPLPSPRDVLLSAGRGEPEPIPIGDTPQAPGDADPALKAPLASSQAAPAGPKAADHERVTTGSRKGLGPAAAGDTPSISAADAIRFHPMSEAPGPEKSASVFAAPLEVGPHCGPELEANEAAPPVARHSCGSDTVASAEIAAPSALVSRPTVAERGENSGTTGVANSPLSALAEGLAASAVTRGRVADSAVDETKPGANNAAAPVSQAVRTLEDTVADLLRPMLRQWLDANMPKVVEKALRGELAEAVKPVPKREVG